MLDGNFNLPKHQNLTIITYKSYILYRMSLILYKNNKIPCKEYPKTNTIVFNNKDFDETLITNMHRYRIKSLHSEIK